jgi:hypothetical protein
MVGHLEGTAPSDSVAFPETYHWAARGKLVVRPGTSAKRVLHQLPFGMRRGGASMFRLLHRDHIFNTHVNA